MRKRFRSQKTITKLFVLAVLLIISCVLIVKVKATDDVDETDTYFESVRGQLLGFYSSEIISHAGIILGLIVGLPSIVKTAWKWLYRGKIRRFIALFVLPLALILVLYSFGRLIYWSSLSSALTVATRQDLEVTITNSNVTSFMYAFVNYTDKAFRADPSITSELARWFFPSVTNFALAVFFSVTFAVVSYCLISRIYRVLKRCYSTLRTFKNRPKTH
jgi:hypothetical protein